MDRIRFGDQSQKSVSPADIWGERVLHPSHYRECFPTT